MTSERYVIGVDLGGTKIEAASVDEKGQICREWLRRTDVSGGVAAVKEQIIDAVMELQKGLSAPAVGVGVGVAGQVRAKSGEILFAPNLGWREVPFQADLNEALDLPVVITNDVRAATWGEWLYGAGRGCDDLICLFIGTGIGGGVVSGGRMIEGCSNTAGEVGHIVVDLRGPVCTCGSQGCMEAIAGGWAITQRAQQLAATQPSRGGILLDKVAGRHENITTKILAEAWRAGDPLAQQVVLEAAEALIAGIASLINAFNPCRIILGGGIMEGFPELIERIKTGVQVRALAAATGSLQILPASLGNRAGVVGAAALAMRTFLQPESG